MLIKLAGCILVLTGCVGSANAWCREQKHRLLLLKQIRKIYEDMKYYISYQRITIPEALLRIGEIYREQKKGEMEFPLIWKEQMEKILFKTPLHRQEWRLLLDFPSCLGFMKENAQAGALDELLRAVIQRIAELEAEQKSKNKMVMSLGLAGGILVTILLL